MIKVKVLVFSDYYLPGYKAGGPIRTIANMVEVLSDKIDFYIVTNDRDSLDEVSYEHLSEIEGWVSVGKAKVLYLSPKDKSFSNIKDIINSTPHDILYLNSFFSFHYSIIPLLLRRLGLISPPRVVLAPRGEFSRSALKIKPVKKALYGFVSRISGLHRAIKWQASTSKEHADIFRVIKCAKPGTVTTAIDLPDVTTLSAKHNFIRREKGASLRVIFLSRVSPMKNLDYALKILGESKENIDFHIYGLISNKLYYRQCMNVSKAIYPNLNVKYKGHVNNDRVVTLISEYDLFILPTKGENYGHVILEALTAGTPVLISDRTPWCDVDSKGVGWALPLSDEERFIEKVRLVSSFSCTTQLKQRHLCRSYAEAMMLNSSDLQSNYNLFLT